MSESVKAAALEAASFKEAGFRAVKIKVTDDFENDDDDSGDDDDDIRLGCSQWRKTWNVSLL